MRRWTGLAAAVIGVALLAGVAWYAIRGDHVPFLASEQCTADVGGESVVLDTSQARYAGLITAIAVQRGMPARAASIALAAAYQESKLHNLRGGDRDSAGLFQQRPSQGWGTTAQVRDPVRATNAFYDALEKVTGYEQMDITVAAQRVQRSGFPDAYAAHEPEARALASALTGNSPAAFSCRLLDDAAKATAGTAVARADAVRSDLRARFPDQSLEGDGSTFDVAVRPASPANRTRGWAIAQYLVSQAARLSISTVAFDGRTWTSGDHSGDGWRTDAAAADHREQVQVTVR